MVMKWSAAIPALFFCFLLSIADSRADGINKHVRADYLDLPGIEKCEFDGEEILHRLKYGRLIFTDSRNDKHPLHISLDDSVSCFSSWVTPSKDKGGSGEKKPIRVIVNPVESGREVRTFKTKPESVPSGCK